MPYGPRFEEALAWVCELHRLQVRKHSSAPYITHLLAVASLVGENGGDEDAVIAALLHDAVEDQGGAATRRIIAQRFGEAVARIVDGCTDTDQTPKPPWRARKEAYIAHLADASPDVLLVSIADKIHNSRSILMDLRRRGDAAWAIFQGGKDGTLWYYRELVNRFRDRAPPHLVDELDRTVTAIEALGLNQA